MCSLCIYQYYTLPHEPFENQDHLLIHNKIYIREPTHVSWGIWKGKLSIRDDHASWNHIQWDLPAQNIVESVSSPLCFKLCNKLYINTGIKTSILCNEGESPSCDQNVGEAWVGDISCIDLSTSEMKICKTEYIYYRSTCRSIVGLV